MAAAGCIRFVFRSSVLRSAAAKLTSTPTKRPTFVRTRLSSKQTPRFLRRPVEMSCCVESLLPLHSATASALLTSMLASSRPGFGWLIDGFLILDYSESNTYFTQFCNHGHLKKMCGIFLRVKA